MWCGDIQELYFSDRLFCLLCQRCTRRIIISAGPLVGASGINHVGSMMVLYALFISLVSVSSVRSVIASVFVKALCA